MRILFTTVLSVLLISSAFAQLISYEKLESYTIAGLDTFIENELGVPPSLIGLDIDYPVDYYRVVFETPYGHPDSIVRATGAICMPRGVDCGSPISSWGHGTQTRRSRAASTMNGGTWQIGPTFASTGYIVCLPDFVGLGAGYDTTVRVHPYQHEFSQAHNTLNILRAARQLADTLGVNLNGDVFLFGYSQGGYVTAATHKLIEAEHAAEFQITASAPMSGSYDMTGVQAQEILSDSVYATPGYLPFLLYGWYELYPSLQAAYPDVDKIFKSPFDTLLPPAFFEDDLSIGTINQLCANNGGAVPKNMIQDSILQAFLDDSLSHPLRVALADNDLVYNWVPQAPLRMYYCEADEQVPFENTLVAYDVWTNAGATNVSKQRLDSDASPLMHTPCAQPALIAAKSFFDSLRIECTNISENFLNDRISIYPNPSMNEVSIRFAEYTNTTVLITDLAGREVQQIVLSRETTELNISNWTKGVYFFRFENNLGRTTKKLIKN